MNCEHIKFPDEIVLNIECGAGWIFQIESGTCMMASRSCAPMLVEYGRLRGSKLLGFRTVSYSSEPR